MSQFQTPANWNVTATSSIFKLNSNDSFSIITTHDSTITRNGITALFVVLNFCLAVTGAAYIKSRARSRVARGQSVPVKHLISWLSLPDVVNYTWSLRSFPGGWLGFLMVFSGLINILHQFATNTLVTPANIPARCVFDYGSVMNNEGIQSAVPMPDDDAANLVYQAQLAALKNGGAKGIYHKFFAPNEIPMFRPEAQDVHGGWNCQNVKNDTLPWHGAQVDGNALATSERGGVPYSDYLNYFNNNPDIIRKGEWTRNVLTLGNDIQDELAIGFMIMSAPAQRDWKVVHASILNGLPLKDGKATVMNFDCHLTLNQSVHAQIENTMFMWSTQAWGYQSSLTTVQESGLWLELTMNAITNLIIFNDWIVPENVKPKSTIGCVVEGTRVSVGIVIILVAVAVVFLGLLLALISVLIAQSRRGTNSHGKLLPFDLADWQLAAYRQCKGERAPSFKELRDSVCRHDPSEDGLWMEVRHADASGQYQMAAGALSTLPEKFDWRSQGKVERGPSNGSGRRSVFEESFSNKPWVDIKETPLERSYSRRSQSSTVGPYSSLSASYESDDRWLLNNEK